MTTDEVIKEIEKDFIFFLSSGGGVTFSGGEPTNQLEFLRELVYYFYKKGYKQFIYYPIIVFIYVVIMVYSPVVNIKYYNEGAMVISFRGRRALIQYNEGEDNDKLKKITLCEKTLNNDFKKFLIKDGVYIKRSGENYILKTKKEQCLLKINYDKINYNYEIIDFTKGDIEDVWIVKDIIISRR